MLTQHLQKLRHAVTVQRTFPLTYKHLQNAPLPSMNCISHTERSNPTSFKVLRENTSFEINLQKINTNTLQIIMNVLRFFSTAQGTQARMLAINTSFFTQNHVKQVVVEKEE